MLEWTTAYWKGGPSQGIALYTEKRRKSAARGWQGPYEAAAEMGYVALGYVNIAEWDHNSI